jgi:drug/metabolite transporter (DMT)-like permease
VIFGIVLCFAAGAAMQGYFAFKKRELRECGVLLGLVAVGVLFAALYYADANERIYPLGVLNRLFRPLTEWMYDAL